METLGLSSDTARSEGRLKSLFWPSIQNANDVEYLGAQGYWVCAAVAALSFVGLIVTGSYGIAAIALLFFYLGGVGVREGSVYAAGVVFTAYVVELPLANPSIVRILLTAVLLSNLRATWIASHWETGQASESAIPRFDQTLFDKFVDQWPRWLWPKVRLFYYVFSAAYLALVGFGLTLLYSRPR